MAKPPGDRAKPVGDRAKPVGDRAKPVGDRARDPRIERSHRLVKTAALAELGAVGYGAFAVESVARRSGVAKSTIYRHWPGKLALISDALQTLNVQPPAAHHADDPAEAPVGADPVAAPRTDPAGSRADPRARVEQLVTHLAAAFLDTRLSACMPALIEAGEHDPAVRAFLHGYSGQRLSALTDAIADGVAGGDFRADLDPETAGLALSGPIVYCRLMTGQPFGPARCATLVDTVLGPADGRLARAGRAGRDGRAEDRGCRSDQSPGSPGNNS